MQLNSYSKLSLATKEEITRGFQEMKTSREMLSLAIKEKITMGFQEMKTTHDGGYCARNSLSILILGFHS